MPLKEVSKNTKKHLHSKENTHHGWASTNQASRATFGDIV